MESKSTRQKIQRRGPGYLEHIDDRSLATQKADQSKASIKRTSGYEEQRIGSLYDFVTGTCNVAVINQMWLPCYRRQ